eukprot:13052207-Ditylum_brightwellii.AAC.1
MRVALFGGEVVSRFEAVVVVDVVDALCAVGGEGAISSVALSLDGVGLREGAGGTESPLLDGVGLGEDDGKT